MQDLFLFFLISLQFRSCHTVLKQNLLHLGILREQSGIDFLFSTPKTSRSVLYLPDTTFLRIHILLLCLDHKHKDSQESFRLVLCFLWRNYCSLVPVLAFVVAVLSFYPWSFFLSLESVASRELLKNQWSQFLSSGQSIYFVASIYRLLSDLPWLVWLDQSSQLLRY